MTWRPGHRAAARMLEDPFEDLPPHLDAPLWGWASGMLRTPWLLSRLCIAMRWELDPMDSLTPEATLVWIRHLVDGEPTRLLDIVEWCLERDHPQLGALAEPEDVQELDELLELGNSIYRVRADAAGLELRVLPEVREQVQAVVDAAVGSPGAHLAAAWNAAYGRVSDPVKAYSEAIKAVEAASAVIVSPANNRATLGTMIRDVEAKPAKWHFAIQARDGDSVDEVRRMMKLLWEGQTSRHGGNQPTQPESPESAKAAVLLAAVLVQFCVGGTFAVSGSSK